MQIDINYNGKEESFNTIEEAQEFADNLEYGYDIWLNDKLYQTKIKNFKTGETEIINY